MSRDLAESKNLEAGQIKKKKIMGYCYVFPQKKKSN